MATHLEIANGLGVSTKTVQRLKENGFLKQCPKGQTTHMKAKAALKRYLAKHQKAGRPHDKSASEKHYEWLAQVITAANKKQRFSKWRFDQLQSAIWPHPDLNHDAALHKTNPDMLRYVRIFSRRPLTRPDRKILELVKKTVPNLKANLVCPLAAHFIHLVQYKTPLMYRPFRLTSKVIGEQRRFSAKCRRERSKLLKQGGRRLKKYLENQYGIDRDDIRRLRHAHERDEKFAAFYRSEQGIVALNGDTAKARELWLIHKKLSSRARAAAEEIEKKRLYFLANKLDRQFDEQFFQQPIWKYSMGGRDYGGLRGEMFNLEPKRVLPFYKILGVSPRTGQRAAQRTKFLFKKLKNSLQRCNIKNQEETDEETLKSIFSDNCHYERDFKDED